MTLTRLRLWIQALFLAITLSACGGGGDDISSVVSQRDIPQAGKPVAQPVVVDLQSDAGDFIGQGRIYRYTKADAVITAGYANGVVSISIAGDQDWTGNFQVPGAPSTLKAGTYTNLGRYPFTSAAAGGMSWSGEGRACNSLVGSFKVSNVVYTRKVLESFSIEFEQHCEGITPALRGSFLWSTKDTTTFAGPVYPPPDNLWKPAAGTTPTSGRYVYIKSDSGDYIGAGGTHLYTAANSALTMDFSAGLVRINVNGNETWTGNFKAMDGLTQLQPGYYGSLQRYPFHNPARGGLDWSGQGRGCNTLTGWFVVDKAAYVNGALSSIKLRFEQHCEGVAAALRGEISWTATDTTTPGGPLNPAPADLWRAAEGATPASGNYVYLASEAGDYIGQGQTYLYTSANATLSAFTDVGFFRMNVGGTDWWYGDFKAMSVLTQLQPGYYSGLQRYPFHNPAKGGLSWSGMGRGCNTLTGWFVVDDVRYVNGALDFIDLRFEQHCEGLAPALRGQVRWQR